MSTLREILTYPNPKKKLNQINSKFLTMKNNGMLVLELYQTPCNNLHSHFRTNHTQ